MPMSLQIAAFGVLFLLNVAVLIAHVVINRRWLKKVERMNSYQSTRRLSEEMSNEPFSRIASPFRSIGVYDGRVEVYEKGQPIPMRFELGNLWGNRPYALLRAIAHNPRLRVPVKEFASRAYRRPPQES